MGWTIDVWIEYDDSLNYYPERVGEPPFSIPHDNCIPFEHFYRLHGGKDYRFLTAVAGVQRQDDDLEPLFPLRGGLPPNVSGYARHFIRQLIDEDDPSLSWLTYPEIEQSLEHLNVKREDLSLAVNLVLDTMQSIEKRLGVGRSRMIFYAWY